MPIAPVFLLTEAPGAEGAGLAARINPPPYPRARAPLKYTGIKRSAVHFGRAMPQKPSLPFAMCCWLTMF